MLVTLRGGLTTKSSKVNRSIGPGSLRKSTFVKSVPLVNPKNISDVFKNVVGLVASPLRSWGTVIVSIAPLTSVTSSTICPLKSALAWRESTVVSLAGMGKAPGGDEERLLAVFRALDGNGVDYAVFGAIALGLHGLARATGDLDLFLRPDPDNVERLKTALRVVFDDPSIAEISAADLCGDYPAVRYVPPEGFGFDLVTRLGEAVRYADLEIEVKRYEDVPVRVVSPRTLWRLKKDTVRPMDRLDAAMLAEKFGFEEN